MKSQVVRVKELTRLESDAEGHIHGETWKEIEDCPEEISQEMADWLWHEHSIGQEELDENNVKVVEEVDSQ